MPGNFWWMDPLSPPGPQPQLGASALPLTLMEEPSIQVNNLCMFNNTRSAAIAIAAAASFLNEL